MGGFCLLVDMHREGSAPAACAAGLFKGYIKYFKSIIINIEYILILVYMSRKDKERTKKNIIFFLILSTYIQGYCSNLFIGPYSMRKMDTIKCHKPFI